MEEKDLSDVLKEAKKFISNALAGEELSPEVEEQRKAIIKALTEVQQEQCDSPPSRPPKERPANAENGAVSQADTDGGALPEMLPPRSPDAKPTNTVEEELYDDTVPQAEIEDIYDDTVPQTETEDIYDDTVPQTETEDIYDDTIPQAESEDIYDDTVPQTESEDIYDDTVPQPSIPENMQGKATEDQPSSPQETPDDYAIAETKPNDDIPQEDYEVLPHEQTNEQEEDTYDLIMPSKPSPSLPSTQHIPSNDDHIDYTLPVKVSEIKDIIKEGWLDKHKKEGQFSLISKFQKRYCVLVEHALYYYKHIKDKSQRGQIILPGYQITYPPKHVQGTKKIDHCFELNGHDKRKFQVIQFMASSKEDALDWKHHIERQLSRDISKRQSVKFLEMEKKSVEVDKDNSEAGSEESSLCGGEDSNERDAPSSEDLYELLPDEQTPSLALQHTVSPEYNDDSEDLYEAIPGNQQAPIVPSPTPPSSSIPATPTTPPRKSQTPVVPALPPRRPDKTKPVVENQDLQSYDTYDDVDPSLAEKILAETKEEQGKAEQQQDEEFYDDVAVSAQEDQEDFYDDVVAVQVAAAAISVSGTDIKLLEGQEANSDDILPSKESSTVVNEEPAPIPARPPKPGAKTNVQEPKEDQPMKSPTVDSNINPAEIYVALWNCSADGEDELDFSRGDFIHVVNKVSDDWWIGKSMNLQQIVGLVPSTYLQEAYYL